jgi:hypothetical protein
MSKGSSSGFLKELERVREELAAWRANLGKGKEIPETVWRKAAGVAKKYGVNPVSKALGLDYNCLKRRVRGEGEHKGRRAGGVPAFVEIKPETSAAELACVIELEKGSGTRLRVCVQSASSVDWCRIKEAFLGA